MDATVENNVIPDELLDADYLDFLHQKEQEQSPSPEQEEMLMSAEEEKRRLQSQTPDEMSEYPFK